MPYAIRKGSGDRPYKIVNKETGKTVGTSTSKAAAQKSINARNAGKHGWKPPW
jgi:hypothetical protein